jgi:hypothetical protein
MAYSTTNRLTELMQRPSDYLMGRPSQAELEAAEAYRKKLMIAGAIAIGVGALGWYLFGPDLRRYMKIRSM